MQEIVKKVGSWLFLVGVLVALIAGIIVGGKVYEDSNAYIAGLLGVLGFAVGILSFFALGNITHEKVPTFLLGALILVVIGATTMNYWETWQFANTDFVFFFQTITAYIAFFAAPAAALLAVRAIWDAGKTEEIERVIPKIENK